VGGQRQRENVRGATIAAILGVAALFGLYASIELADQAASPLISVIDKSLVGTGRWPTAPPRDPSFWLILPAMLERDPHAVKTWASSLVPPTESVVAVPQAYFALKTPARNVIFPTHLHQLGQDERRRDSVARYKEDEYHTRE